MQALFFPASVNVLSLAVKERVTGVFALLPWWLLTCMTAKDLGMMRQTCKASRWMSQSGSRHS